MIKSNEYAYVSIVENYVIKGNVISRLLVPSSEIIYVNIPSAHIIAKDHRYHNIYHLVVLPHKWYVCMARNHELLCSGQYLLDLFAKVANCHLCAYA